MKKNVWIFIVGLVFLIAFLMLRPSANQVVEKGDTVTIDYTLVLEDGTVYYSSFRQDPVKETLGQGNLIAGLEEELIGMKLGEVKTFTVPPENAYGEYRPDLVGTVDRSWLPENVEPVVGKQLQTKLEDGMQKVVTIKSFTDTSLTLDANHPLAGKTLTFQVQLLALEKNPAAGTLINPTNLSWLIFGVGVMSVGFVFFYRRNQLRPFVIRRVIRPQLIRKAHQKL